MKGTIIVRISDTSDEEVLDLKKAIKPLLEGIEGATLETMTQG